MAISARFSADFSSFNDAVQKAEIELRGFEGAAGKVESALSRMTDNFSGRKIITDATLMAQAVENVGGVTKLTAAELAKVGASAQEAAAKFRAWGQEVPPKIQAIADSVKNAEVNTRSWASQLSSLGGIFGVTLSAAGIVGFANELLRTGDELVRVADRTGLTTEEVQKLQFIAGQSGNTIDDLTGAIGKLQKNLTTGDAGAVAAVKQLGLNLDALKAATPFDQMAQLATAIEGVGDPAQRATLAIQLFGRNGAAILPTLVSQFQALGDAAPVMSDKTVRALDAAGDSLNKFGQQVKVWAAETYNFAGQLFDRLTALAYQTAASILGAITTFLEIEQHIPGVTTAFNKLGISTQSLRDYQQQLKDTGSLLVSHLSDQETVVRKTASSFTDFEPKIEKATRAVKEHDAAVIGLGEGEKTLTGTLQLAQKMFQAYYERLEQLIPAQRDWWNEIAQTNGEIEVLASHGIPQATGALVDLGSGVVHLGDKIADAMKESGGFLDGFATRLGQIGSVLNGVQGEWADFAKIGINALQGVAQALAKGDVFGAIVAGATAAVAVVTKLWGKIRQLFGGPSEDELAARDEFAKSFDSADQAIAELGKKLSDAGHGGEEARVLIQALLDATHQSAKAVDDAMQAINDRIAGTSSAIDAATDATNKFGDALNRLPSGPTSDTIQVAPGVSYGSTGGMVTPMGIQHFTGGGRVLPFTPRGVDTVPAMLSPGEVVLNKAQQQSMWGGGSQAPIHTHVYLNGREIATAVSDDQDQQYRRGRKVRVR